MNILFIVCRTHNNNNNNNYWCIFKLKTGLGKIEFDDNWIIIIKKKMVSNCYANLIPIFDKGLNPEDEYSLMTFCLLSTSTTFVSEYNTLLSSLSNRQEIKLRIIIKGFKYIMR